MLVDYHTHSKYCRHAKGELDEYIERAVGLGLDEVGTSDHAPLPGGYDLEHRATLEEYQGGYARAVEELVERYKGKISVKRGIECDFLPWATEWNRGFIRENDFDYVIGSVHFVGEKGRERGLFGQSYAPSELEDLNVEYYCAVAEAARSGLFDVVAHIDLVKKLGPCETRKVEDALRAALDQIRAANLCLEINTSGLRRPEREMYPGGRILAIAKDLKIPMTLGSDAHKPEDVARGFDLAIAALERYAGGRLSVYEKRQRSEVQVSKIRI